MLSHLLKSFLGVTKCPRSHEDFPEDNMDFNSASRIYDLEQPRYFGSPVHRNHMPGLIYSLHRRHEQGASEARTSASGFVSMPEHSGTHIDALCHQAEEMHLYGGQEVNLEVQTPAGFTVLGVETIPPLITRGVLLDVARYKAVQRIEVGHPITRADLEETARSEGIAIGEGSIVLVRTGNGAIWHDTTAYLLAAGISADASSWLASQRVLAVGADNVAWDDLSVIDPDLKVSLPGHLILLVRHGIYIIENLNLEDIARDRCYEFTFICLPLKIQGATGSPVRPIAVAPNFSPGDFSPR
jgi:kynurenine formamidase